MEKSAFNIYIRNNHKKEKSKRKLIKQSHKCLYYPGSVWNSICDCKNCMKINNLSQVYK